MLGPDASESRGGAGLGVVSGCLPLRAGEGLASRFAQLADSAVTQARVAPTRLAVDELRSAAFVAGLGMDGPGAASSPAAVDG